MAWSKSAVCNKNCPEDPLGGFEKRERHEEEKYRQESSAVELSTSHSIQYIQRSTRSPPRRRNNSTGWPSYEENDGQQGNRKNSLGFNLPGTEAALTASTATLVVLLLLLVLRPRLGSGGRAVL